MAIRWKMIALNARALLVGVLTAIVLVAGYTYLNGWRAAHTAHIDGANLLIPLNFQVAIAISLTLYNAVIIAVCCIPIWLWLKSRGFASVWTAGALGYLATATLWTWSNLTEQSVLWDLIFSGLPYATCGALAGVATWWARPRPVSTVR